MIIIQTTTFVWYKGTTLLPYHFQKSFSLILSFKSKVNMIIPKDIVPRSLELVARQYGSYYGRCNPYYSNCNSAWHRWGRWVLAGVLIFIGIVLLLTVLLCGACRRRRSRKTAYTSTPMDTQPPTQYYGNSQQYNSAPPQQYNPPAGAPPQYGNEGYNGYYGQTGGVTAPNGAHVK